MQGKHPLRCAIIPVPREILFYFLARGWGYHFVLFRVKVFSLVGASGQIRSGECSCMGFKDRQIGGWSPAGYLTTGHLSILDRFEGIVMCLCMRLSVFVCMCLSLCVSFCALCLCLSLCVTCVSVCTMSVCACMYVCVCLGKSEGHRHANCWRPHSRARQGSRNWSQGCRGWGRSIIRGGTPEFLGAATGTCTPCPTEG